MGARQACRTSCISIACATPATQLLEDGARIEEVQDHLGHTDIRNTMIYANVTDKENGVAMGITLFDTEEDMQRGHETLNAMTPPAGGMGQRTSVEMYEVPVTFQQS